LKRVILMLENDSKDLPFDWIDSTNRELAVLINTGNDERAQQIMNDSNVLLSLEQLIKQAKTSDET